MIYVYTAHYSCSQLINVLNNIKGINWYIIDLLLLESSDDSIINKQAINLIKKSMRIWCKFIPELVNLCEDIKKCFQDENKSSLSLANKDSSLGHPNPFPILRHFLLFYDSSKSVPWTVRWIHIWDIEIESHWRLKFSYLS